MRRKMFCLMIVVAIVAVLGLTYSSSAKQRVKGKDRILSKITFIHYKKGHAKPPWAGGGGSPNDGEEQGVYTYIAKGTKWKVIEDVRLNPNSDENLDDLIIDAVLAGLEEWETAGGDANLAIFGDVIIDESVSYRGGALRGSNTISFGSYYNSGVIGVTTVWGYFTGPPSQREIVEAHLLMNDDFKWGDASVDNLLMDVQNIMTHELGHWAGMGDLYESGGIEETMYGYSAEGEVKKRTLYFGDIRGITEMYK